ncbi:MAG: hypothetical protein ACYS8W_12490 [Planctomycetota bacterium]
MGKLAIIPAILAFMILAAGCSAPAPIEPPEYTNSELFRHLRRGQRDAIYCAATYIALKNGPQFYGNPVPQLREEWLDISEKYIEYLRSADREITMLMIDNFPPYVLTWSPFFESDLLDPSKVPERVPK